MKFLISLIFIITVLTINIYSVNAQSYSISDTNISDYPTKMIEFEKGTVINYEDIRLEKTIYYGDGEINILIEDNKVYEIFLGCNKISEFKHDVYGCKIWTDLYFKDVHVLNASWWNETWNNRKEVNYTNNANVPYNWFPIYNNFTDLEFISLNEFRLVCDDSITEFDISVNGTDWIYTLALINLTADDITTCYLYYGNPEPIEQYFYTDLYKIGTEPIIIYNNFLNASFYNSTVNKYGLYQVGNKGLNGVYYFGTVTGNWEYASVGDGDSGIYGNVPTNADSDIMIYDNNITKKIKESWTGSGNYRPSIKQYNTFYAHNNFFKQDIQHYDSIFPYAFMSWASQFNPTFTDNIVINGSMTYLSIADNYFGLYNHSAYGTWTIAKNFGGAYRLLYPNNGGVLPADSTWRYIANLSVVIGNEKNDIDVLKELFDNPPSVYVGSEESYVPSNITFIVENYEPENNTATYNHYPNFSFYVNGTELYYNCSLYLTNSTGYSSIHDNCYFTNATNGTINECESLFPFDNDVYLWFVECQNTTVLNQSSNFTLTIGTYIFGLNTSLNYCQNDYNLLIHSEYENCTYSEYESCSIHTFEKIIFCPHGCIDNRTKFGADCYEPNYIWVIILALIIIIAFAVLFKASR